MPKLYLTRVPRVIQKKLWNAVPWTERSVVLDLSLEARLVRSEILIGHICSCAAECAYSIRDRLQANEGQLRAQATYSRANRLLANMAEGDRESMAAELAGLHTALDVLSMRRSVPLRTGDWEDHG
jgi:hypothetical protein